MKAELYDALRARLATITELKHIDLFTGQYTAEDGESALSELPFNCPAVFIEFQPAETTTVGRKRIHVSQTLFIHVVQEVIQEVSNRESSAIRQKAYNKWAITDTVVGKLVGFTDNNLFGTIQLTNLEPFSGMIGALQVDIIPIRTRVLYQAAEKVYTNIEPDPNLNVQGSV